MAPPSAAAQKSLLRKRALAKGYRSGLEDQTASRLTALDIPFTYEGHVIKYTVPARVSRYSPDFVLPNGIIVETKGLWDSDDRKKIALVLEQYPELDLRMVFTNSRTKITKTSKTSYAMVCDKLGLKWADKTIPSAWLSEPLNVASHALIESMRK